MTAGADLGKGVDLVETRHILGVRGTVHLGGAPFDRASVVAARAHAGARQQSQQTRQVSTRKAHEEVTVDRRLPARLGQGARGRSPKAWVTSSQDMPPCAETPPPDAGHATSWCSTSFATRKALAMMVRAGFTAELDTKKLASAMYRLSRS